MWAAARIDPAHANRLADCRDRPLDALAANHVDLAQTLDEATNIATDEYKPS